MKANITKRGTYTLSGITDAQYRAMRSVLQTADERCFDEKIDDVYYSGEDFVCSLDEQEREGLRQVCEVL